MGAVIEGRVEDLQIVARLTDPEFHAREPHDVYARLRREAPVFWYEAGELWGVSKWDDVKFVLSHPELFSSMYGLTYNQSMPVDDGSPCPMSGMPRRAELRRRAYLAFGGSGDEQLIASDPPRHTQLRRLVGPAFSPRIVAPLEDGIRALAREAVETIDPGSVTDVLDAIARPIPLFVIAQLLGVPRDDWQTFARWSDAASDAIADTPDTERFGEWMEQFVEFGMYFTEQLERRRAEPRDDLLTAIQTEIDGAALSEMDQIMFALLLLAAGNETTQTLVAGGFRALAEHPDQRKLLADVPAAIPDGVEEMLRFVTPVPTFCRTAKETTELRGQRIEKGDYLVVLFSAANRDEDVWEEPESFRVTRKPGAQVSFGFGPHFCLGATLARLEARVIFEEVLRRYPDFELAGEVTRVPSTITRYKSVPILFHKGR